MSPRTRPTPSLEDDLTAAREAFAATGVNLEDDLRRHRALTSLGERTGRHGTRLHQVRTDAPVRQPVEHPLGRDALHCYLHRTLTSTPRRGYAPDQRCALVMATSAVTRTPAWVRAGTPDVSVEAESDTHVLLTGPAAQLAVLFEHDDTGATPPFGVSGTDTDALRGALRLFAHPANPGRDFFSCLDSVA